MVPFAQIIAVAFRPRVTVNVRRWQVGEDAEFNQGPQSQAGVTVFFSHNFLVVLGEGLLLKPQPGPTQLSLASCIKI